MDMNKGLILLSKEDPCTLLHKITKKYGYCLLHMKNVVWCNP